MNTIHVSITNDEGRTIWHLDISKIPAAELSSTGDLTPGYAEVAAVINKHLQNLSTDTR
jgi:hypothetical protein